MLHRNQTPSFRKEVPFVLLLLWGAFVLIFFFREHPLDLVKLWRLVRSFSPPPVPTAPVKLLLVLKHLSLACFLGVVGLLTGRRILKIVGVWPPHDQAIDGWRVGENLLMALGLGWGVLVYFTFLLGVVGVLYEYVVWAVLLLLLLICITDAPLLVREVRGPLARRQPVKPPLPLRLGAVFFVLVTASVFVMALAPSITHDAMVYHLNIPRVYANAHAIVPIPYNLFSNTFLNLEMLYLIALLIDDFILANLIHFSLGVSAMALTFAFARRTLGRTTAVLAVFIFFFNPLVLNEMAIAYVDLGMVFYFLLALVCLWRWKEEDDRRWFLIACVFAGFFAGFKYTSLHGLVSIGAMIAIFGLLSERRGLKTAFKNLATYGLVTSAFVLPYLIKNHIFTGNPVYPLMYEQFDGRWLFPQQVERMLAYVNAHGMGRDFPKMLLLPWNITVHGNAGFKNFDAVITPLWLLFLAPLLFIRPKPPVVRVAGLLCAIYFVSWAASTHITRYLMPVFPLFSMLSAHGISAIWKRATEHANYLSMLVKAGTVTACGLVWLLFSYPYLLYVPSEFGPVVWGNQTREEFLATKVPHYSVFEYINETLPANARLVFFWDNRGFFCDRPQIGDSVFEASSMLELFSEAGNPAAYRQKLNEMGITHIFVNKAFFRRFPPFAVSPKDEARILRDVASLERFLARHAIPVFSDGETAVYELTR